MNSNLSPLIALFNKESNNPSRKVDPGFFSIDLIVSFINFFTKFFLLSINKDKICSSFNSFTNSINLNFDICKAKLEFSSGIFISILSQFKSFIINWGSIFIGFLMLVIFRFKRPDLKDVRNSSFLISGLIYSWRYLFDKPYIWSP